MSYTTEHRNEVHLAGRVTREAVVNQLPSGDAVANLWIVVERPPLALVRPRRQRVDTVELVAWKTSLHDVVSEWREGDFVTVSGALRHRFWQSEGGLRSKYEVELDEAVLVHRPEPSPEDTLEPEPAGQRGQ
jgi:single-strand DNA-binding protein